MIPESRTQRFVRWLAMLAATTAAFALMALGGIVGHGLLGKVLGTALGAFLGGLIVAQLRTPKKSRLTVAAGWSAFAIVGVLSAYGVFIEAPDSGHPLVFAVAGLAGGFFGGIVAAVIQGPMLWTLPRMRVQWSVVEAAALTGASFVFLVVFRLEHFVVALPLAAIVYASAKQFQPVAR